MAMFRWQAALEPFPGEGRSDTHEEFVQSPLGTFVGNEPCYSPFRRLVWQGLSSNWPSLRNGLAPWSSSFVVIPIRI